VLKSRIETDTAGSRKKAAMPANQGKDQSGEAGQGGIGAGAVNPAADQPLHDAVDVQVTKLSTPVTLPICRTESSWVKA